MPSATIKDIAILGGFLLALTGFYFSTGYRLDTLEAQASEISKQEIILNEITVRLIRIEDGISVMKEDIDDLEKLLKRRANNVVP